MNRRFYNYTCTIYTFGQVEERGTMVEGKILKYSNIKCAIWKSTRRGRYGETPLAVQTADNSFEMNLEPQYSSVAVGDVVESEMGTFKIEQIVKHHNHRGRLENLQIFISSTT